LRAARVHTRHIFIRATCKHHVEKGLTLIGKLKDFLFVLVWKALSFTYELSFFLSFLSTHRA